MNRRIRIALASLGFAAALAAQPAPKSVPPQDNRAAAYYNFAMGHMYAELAASYGYRSEYVDKAIDHYKAAMKADPSAAFLSEELTDLYVNAGKLRDAVLEAEEMLKRNPDNVEARHMLGRIYSRMIGDQQQNRINENMLKSAVEQYSKVVAKEPKDVDSWLMLGRLHKIGQDSVESERAYKKVLELEPDNEYALMGLGMVYSDLGDNAGALRMWQRLAELKPSPRTLKALAQAYEQARDHKSAAQALQKALELEPRSTEVKRALAENLLMSDQVEQAEKIYAELAAADPKDPQLFIRLSQAYRQKRDFAKAREAQDKARALDPDSLEVRYNDVNLLDAEGKYAEAITQLKGILASTERKSYSKPELATRVPLLERLGLLYRFNEQFPEAVQAFELMAQADPDTGARSAAQIVDAWRQAKEFTKAVQVADAAIQKYPDNRTVKVVRASVLADVGRVDEGAALMKTLINGKDDRETWITLAQIYDKGKRHEEMARALDAADKLSEGPEEKETVNFLRGAMFEKMKRYDQAETEFRKVLDANPDSAAAMNYLGYMLADRNVRLDEAYKLIRRANDLEPNNGAYLDSLGWVQFRLGRLEEAETNLRAAIARSSRDPVVYDHLADVYLQQGKLKEAIGQWERSLKEWEASAKADYDGAEVAKVHKKLEGARVRLARESTNIPHERR